MSETAAPRQASAPPRKALVAALVVAGGGFVLLNLAFAFLGLLALLADRAFPALGPEPRLALAVYFALLAAASWLVVRSRLPTLAKATLLTLPVASVLAVVGAALWPWPWAAFGLGALLAGGLVAYLVATRRPWLYAYAVVLVAVVMGLFTLLGGEI